WGAGDLLVVWEQDGAIYGQRLARDGRALERPFAMGAAGGTDALQEMPSVAGAPDGRAAVAWRERHDGVVDVALRQIQRCGNGNVDPGAGGDDGKTGAGGCCGPTGRLPADG